MSSVAQILTKGGSEEFPDEDRDSLHTLPISILPEAIQTIAWGLPSYHLGELALMVVGRSDAANMWLHIGPLALITIAAAIFAWTGQQRAA